LDDVVIFSKTFDEHIERLSTVLDRIRTAGLKLKPEKCQFLQSEVIFPSWTWLNTAPMLASQASVSKMYSPSSLGYDITGALIKMDLISSKRIARWLEILSAFNFSIQHRPGNKHGNADSMSKCPSPGECL
jgi:hypothetical protein